MSKYNQLWAHIQEQGSQSLTLSFRDIGRIAGVDLDHFFLNYKKELVDYGYQVKKISMKEQTVLFIKISLD